MIQAKNIFIVGIKGVAMSNLAVILKKMGKNVIGSDTNEEFITDQTLQKNAISWTVGFDPKNLPNNIDLVIYSAAHQGVNNPQVQEAKKRGVKIKSQAEELGELLNLFNTSLAVCGCHGKTTTSSLLAYALVGLGVNPSYLVGSSGFNQFTGGDYQKKNYFVIEADEYGVNPPTDKTPKFHFLKPKYILCTNIDYDHPDVYQNINETKKAFSKFFDGAKIFVCADDKNSLEVISKFDKKNYFTYGFDQSSQYQIVNYQANENGSQFSLKDYHRSYLFEIGLFGQKNISNTAGVIGLLLNLGFSYAQIRQAIKGFTGAKRRFEKIAYINDIYLFDDYGHHPKEIEATIQAAKDRFPDRPIVIIFQPHTYSRTQSLLPDFAKSLSLADLSLLLPIFPSAREDPKTFKISSQDIADEAGSDHVFAFDSKTDLFVKLRSFLKGKEVVFTMGAGDVYKLKDDIIKAISNIKDQRSKI